MKTYRLVTLGLFFLMIYSSREDSFTSNTDVIIPEPTIIIESAVDGFVVEKGQVSE